MDPSVDIFLFLKNIDYRLLAIGAAFFGAIANILARTILKDVKTKDMLGLNFLIMTGTLAVLSPWFFHFQKDGPTIGIMPITVLFVLLVGFIDLIANYFYFKSFEQSEASVATPILSISPGLVFIFSWFFLGDKVSGYNFILALGIIIGILTISTNFSQVKLSNKNVLLPAFIAAVLFALSAVPSKYLLSNGLINPPTLYEIRGGIIGICSMLYFGPGLEKLKNDHFKKIFIRSLFVLTQWILLYSALAVGNAGITITLSSTAPVFVLFLGYFFLKEKISLKKFIAAALVICLAFLINQSNI